MEDAATANAPPPSEISVELNNFAAQPIPTQPTGAPHHTPRKNVCLASTPDSFNGNKANYRRFLRQLKLFLAAYAREFETDEAKIIFVLSLMKKGTAELWAETYMDQVIEHDGYFGSWQTFQNELNKTFIDFEENKRSLQRLDTLVQGKDTAAEFFTKFEQYAMAAGVKIHEDVQVISQVERGLNAGIVDKIYSSGNVPYSYVEYKVRAVAIDELWRRRQEMKQTEGKAKPLVKTDWRDRNKPRTGDRITPRDPNAMDVDATKPKATGACFKCGEQGHFAKNCTKRIQNRSMETTSLESVDEEEKKDTDF